MIKADGLNRKGLILKQEIKMKNNKSIDNIVIDLKERAKELSCLYAIQELFRNIDGMSEICQGW